MLLQDMHPVVLFHTVTLAVLLLMVVPHAAEVQHHLGPPVLHLACMV